MARNKKVYIVYRIIYKHRKTGKRYAYCDLWETAMNEPNSFNAFLGSLKGFEENTNWLVQDQCDFIYRMNSSAIFDKKSEAYDSVSEWKNLYKNKGEWLLDYKQN